MGGEDRTTGRCLPSGRTRETVARNRRGTVSALPPAVTPLADEPPGGPAMTSYGTAPLEPEDPADSVVADPDLEGFLRFWSEQVRRALD